MVGAHVEFTQRALLRRFEPVECRAELDPPHVEILAVGDEQIGQGTFHRERCADILAHIGPRSFENVVESYAAGLHVEPIDEDPAVEKRRPPHRR